MRVIALITIAERILLKLCSACCNDSRHAPVTRKTLREARGKGWLWHCPVYSNSLLGRLVLKTV